MSFATMAQARRKNKQAGYHFFDRDSMRFFDSRIETGIIGGHYFITSEQFRGVNSPDGPRKYTVRRIENGGDVNDVGGFQAYPTKAEARAAIGRLLRPTPSKPTDPRDLYTCEGCQLVKPIEPIVMRLDHDTTTLLFCDACAETELVEA